MEAGRRRGIGEVVVVVAEMDVDMVVMEGVEMEVEHVVVAAGKAGPWLRRIHGAYLLGGGCRDGRRVGGDDILICGGVGFGLKGNLALVRAKVVEHHDGLRLEYKLAKSD